MKYFFYLSFYLISTSLVAQNMIDLVRYSNTQLYGDARFTAMGGSFGALGANLSTALVNPAGFGRYSSSTFNLGLNVFNFNNDASFNSVNTTDSRASFKPSSGGFVFTSDVSGNNKGFQFTQIGFTFNRIANFNNRFSYEGQQYASLLDGYAAQAYGVSTDLLNTYFPFSSYMAYQTYAIDEDGSGGYSPRLTAGDNYHKHRFESKGGLNEYTFSLSTNYINKVYLGVNLGIRTINYTENTSHEETLLDNSTVSLESFSVSNYLKTKGNGYNIKIGAIYLPIENLRFGIALHTPTYFKLEDEFAADMISYHKTETITLASNQKPTGDYAYRLRTPGKIVASAAGVFGTMGSINVDVEYLDYAWANLKGSRNASNSYDFATQNEEADTSLHSVLNLRVGGELVFQSQYFLRGGFAVYPQPYKKSISLENKATLIYSVGFGFKIKRNSFDIGYSIAHKQSNYFYFPQSNTHINSNQSVFSLSYSILF